MLVEPVQRVWAALARRPELVVEQLVSVVLERQAVVLAAWEQAGFVDGRCRLHYRLNQNQVLSAQLCTQLSIRT